MLYKFYKKQKRHFAIFELKLSSNCNICNDHMKAFSCAEPTQPLFTVRTPFYCLQTKFFLQMVMTVQSHTNFCRLCRAGHE